MQRSYADTIPNLKIGKHTRVIYQGFTGRVATTNAQESLKYGTRIVGGVTPGKDGEHLGLPVLPSVAAAKEQLKPDATAIFVAAPHAGKAIEEAIEAEIPLIAAVAEHIPLHDILRVWWCFDAGQCRIGFQPLPTFSPGHIGVVAKSGTLSYETVASISRAGLGQSLCIGMGGDVVAGTNLVEALTVFESDPDTEGIVVVGEVGGRAEEEAAEWIKDYHKRVKQPKPIAALVGGRTAPPGRVMGHAGAWAAAGESTAEEKYKILENAGATMVDHPEKFGNVMKGLLSRAGKDVGKISIIKSALAHLQMDAAPPLAHAQTASAISSLASFFREKEAISLSMHLSITSSGGLCISSPHLHFDDAAFKSSKRQADVHALRDVSLEEGVEVEAEKHGIVFVKLHPGDSSANIGTLVNGAGLAMNTVDALSLPPHGGKCANFLDTGGKATSATVKKSFELILQDPRVKVIFVNIFGGLTDCGMIAEGVILAFKEVDMRGVPVVVRLRGTNEEVGQKKIEESGLRLEAFDGFQEAASRVVELARR
ncbi:hypothetical protein H2203_003183 [Taxawa tesnikishii (nom. ined.)]|nr:hypothetical protein H2203_003183 [Dothideales sp. JES 119]